MASDLSSDDELIAALQRKDMVALEHLYDRHHRLAYALALRMLSNDRDAEEVVQEAFLNVWRAADTFRPERSSGRSWILSVVRHRAVDRLRGRQSRPTAVPLDEEIGGVAHDDTWRDVEANITGEEVRRALDELPPEQRQTIELAFFGGYTHVEIADAMRVPLGTVKGRMRIGLHKLRGLLETSRTHMGID